MIFVARIVSRLAHRKQTDKNGQPYWRHPARVAERCSTPVEKQVAYLHDVLEDTKVSEKTLRRLFSAEVVDAVVALTHLKSERRFAYLSRVRQNDVAVAVKRADIADNTDPERLAALPSALRERLEAKYRESLAFLDADDAGCY